MIDALSAALKKVSQVLFPSRCAFCGRVTTGETGVCEACKATLPLLQSPVCRTCGREKTFCICNRRQFEFSRCVSPFYYEGPAKQGILRLKYGGRQSAAGTLGHFCAEAVLREYNGVHFDFVTAVPMSGREFRDRGLNQSELIARGMSRTLGLSYRNVLVKPAETKPQHNCAARERWGNVFGAYQVRDKLGGKTVLLVDDIVTTGATLSECAKILRLGGAEQVYCITVACVKKIIPV